MANDIAPEIYEKIKKDIADELEKSDKVKGLYNLVASGKADYETANYFSEEIGSIYSRALKNNIKSGVLPDGKMYYNIAERTIRPAMEECYGKVSDVTFNIQSDLNKTAGIGIKAIKPELNSERIEGIINRSCSAENFDDVAWLLDEPIVNFAQSVVDDSVKVNAGFHEKSGLNPTITRSVSGKCCKWCDRLAGTYNYKDAPDDIYRRHEHCRCQVLYNPGKGKRYQNVHTKKWVNPDNQELIEKRKNIGIANLNGREKTAINLYKSAESYQINDRLRNGIKLNKEQEQLTNALDEALEKMPVYNGVVYRSLDSSMMDMKEFRKRYQAGMFVNEPSYISTSTEVYDSSMQIQMIIQSKNGRDLRNYNNFENEILFKRNSKFYVERVEENYLWLTEI